MMMQWFTSSLKLQLHAIIVSLIQILYICNNIGEKCWQNRFGPLQTCSESVIFYEISEV